MSAFSDNLKTLRGETPQSQFAAELGMKQQQYARYEKGVTVPSVDVLSEICRVHACSADWLLGLRGESGAAAASTPPSAPGFLPQCAKCPHRRLAEKMRRMLEGK